MGFDDAGLESFWFWFPLSDDGEGSDLETAVSLISKHRIQILLSASVKLMMWSMKGLDLRAPFGTPNVCVRSS